MKAGGRYEGEFRDGKPLGAGTRTEGPSAAAPTTAGLSSPESQKNAAGMSFWCVFIECACLRAFTATAAAAVTLCVHAIRHFSDYHCTLAYLYVPVVCMYLGVF